MPSKRKSDIPAKLENRLYKVELLPDLRIEVREKCSGMTATYAPIFEVVYRESPPQKSTKRFKEVNCAILSWDDRLDFFQAEGTWAVHAAIGSTYGDNTIFWEFAQGDGYSLQACLQLPEDDGEPRLTYTLLPDKKRYYSVGFAGASERDPDEVDWIFQPMLWHGKRFPAEAYMTEEARCTLPLVLYGEKGGAVGVFVDPADVEFRLSTLANSKFGVLIRNARGNAQPSVYAPIFGGEGSELSSSFSFRLRLLVRAGSLYDTYKYVSTGPYRFCDYRRNGLSSLNTALDNMTDFILNESGNNDYMWNANFKANEYAQDKPGYGRQQSAVDMLALAIVLDSRKQYWERALPTIEYFLSRQSNMVKTGGNGYDPEMPMGTPLPGRLVPGMDAGEYATLDRMTGGRSFVFRKFAGDFYEGLRFMKPETGGGDEKLIDVNRSYTREEALRNARLHWKNAIGMYRMNGGEEDLAYARKIADDYIHWRLEREQPDFAEVKNSFYTLVGPAWYLLVEMFDLTGERKYMDAAVKAAQQFVLFVQMSPVVPQGQIDVDDESVPAWRVAVTGLTTECGGTSHSHRGIFMPYFAAYLARIADYAGDSYLRNVAKANIIGRFANYPGYTMRTRYSAKFEKPDYPLKPYKEYSNTAHMNHPAPMACMVVDYLVTDALCRSRHEIRFPSRYTETAAFFQNKVYGDRPGEFYGDPNVWLWLPKDLLTTDSIQVNYVSGYGNGKLYLALMNQCEENIRVNLSLNLDLVKLPRETKARLWEDSEERARVSILDGEVAVSVAGNGITALAIEDAEAKASFQPEYIQRGEGQLHECSFRETREPFGLMTGMIISLSPSLTSAFFYTDLNPLEAASVTLHYSIDGGPWKSKSKEVYPFEFTLPLTGTEAEIRYYMTDSRGRTSGERRLWASADAEPPKWDDVPSEADGFAEAAEQEAAPAGEAIRGAASGNVKSAAKPFAGKRTIRCEWDEAGAAGWEFSGGGAWFVELLDGVKTLVQNNGEGVSLARFGDVHMADYAFTADIRFRNRETFISSGLVVRCSDPDNYYLLRIFADTGLLQLINAKDGLWTVLDEAPFQSAPEQWYRMRLVADGNRLVAFIDDVEMIHIIDEDAHPEGNAGLWVKDEKIAVRGVSIEVG